jgi:predicted glycoside hydrolase/deacetylase ChbG (UPF0249 family)
MLVVVNADDFGSAPDTVRATIECFEAGALTSATIMPNMPATEAALEFARAHPELGFGVHLTFTGDGLEKPLSDPAAVPALVDADGCFLATGTMRRLALLRRLPVAQIERELEAQLEAVRSAGVPVSHVDSHRHLHKFAPFRAALDRMLPRFGIEHVRNVQDVYLRRPLGSPTFWLGSLWRRSLMRRFATTSHFYMPSSGGDTAWGEALLELAGGLGGGSLEVGVHPGYDDAWRDDERRSVLAFSASAGTHGHRLVGWQEIARA